MNLIPKKYPDTYHWFMSDWTSRTLGGPESTMLRWPRETYGLNYDEFWPVVFTDVWWGDVNDLLL